VNYEDAFDALNNRDFSTAASLFEKASRETGYTSDLINHAYTMALHQLGDKPKLADVAFEIGNSLYGQDPAAAMDYFQRAMFAGLDAKRVRLIGQLFEQWAQPRQEPVRPSVNGPVTRVAHVVGCLLPDHATTRYLQMLVSSLSKQGIDSTVFTTEWSASWFFNPAGAALSQPIDMKAETKVASVEGDFEERATRIASELRASGVPVAFFHASLMEQITTRVASMRSIPVQINVNHESEMDSNLFDGHIHLFENAMQRTRFSDPAEWIPPVSDIETRLQMNEPVTRQSVGLESASSISATFGNLYHVSGSDYLRVLSEILKRFPKHFHLFAGAGNVKAVRSFLHSEGVLPRVRFLGQISDVTPLLDMIDVYLTSFPNSNPYPILDVMGAGKPVVAKRFPPDSQYNSAAEIVGIRELTSRGDADYLEIADRLLRNPEWRVQQAQATRDRFRAEFRPDRLGERYKAFLAPFQRAAAE
jgi:predicted O-linked N-acetylglucosamine transferase (SPINDLY family)